MSSIGLFWFAMSAAVLLGEPVVQSFEDCGGSASVDVYEAAWVVDRGFDGFGGHVLGATDLHKDDVSTTRKSI